MLLLGGGLLAQQADKPKDDEIPIFRAGVTLVKVDVEAVGATAPDILQGQWHRNDQH
jgi:hypothetical protein